MSTVSSDLAERLSSTYAPTLVIFPEDREKIPYDDHRPRLENTGDYHPCPVDLVLGNFSLNRGKSVFNICPLNRRGRPRSFDSERDWLFSLVKQGKKLSNAVINLTDVEVSQPLSAWSKYFSIISHNVSQRDEGHPYPVVTYARVVSGQDVKSAGEELPQEYGHNDIAIQYWWFYYFNHWWNLHEMDWEMITLIVRREEGDDWEPLKAGYATHFSGHQRNWYGVHHNTEVASSPLVFVAAGSHAAYFEYKEDGYHTVAHTVKHISWLYKVVNWLLRRGPSILDIIDIVPPEAPGYFIRPTICLMPSDPPRDDPEWWWMHFDGMWGEMPDKFVDFGEEDITLLQSGIPGPWLQGSKWNNPFQWVDSCRPG